jgi:uncharacterized protein
MRAFAIFLMLIVAALLLMAALAYPAWLLLYPTFDFPFHRIANRLGMLLLLIGFVFAARHLGVADRVSLGFGMPRPKFLIEFGKGLALGVLMMALVVFFMVLFGLRDWQDGIVPTIPTLLALLAKGLLSGILVALIEETFFRGAMYSAVQRESGTGRAILLTAALYAALHFFARVRIAHDEVTAQSGAVLLQGILRSFAEPWLIGDAFLSLLAVGVLLGVVRSKTGNIAACMGLHAGWVWVIALVRETSIADREHPYSFLLSHFDGVVGWLVLLWTLIAGVFVQRYYSKSAAYAVP